MCFGQSCFAQDFERCATFKIDSVKSVKTPQRLRNKSRFENQVRSYLTDNQQLTNVITGIIRIPVVVHIIHNNAQGVIGGTGNINISDEQVYSQIKVLNEDYRKKTNTLGFNTFSFGADTEIEFFLALRDPDGNPSKGITRTYNAKNNYDIFNDTDLLTSLNYWDSNRYLNIWVCAIAGNYLGYTPEFPGAAGIQGLDATDGNEKTDGVVVDYRAFGKKIGTSVNGIYTNGRTTTHEIGHFFGLIHTWGDAFCGDDYCTDTPTEARSNSTRFCRDVFSTCSGTRTRDLIEDYMDYSPDSCMSVFTQNQKDRMRAVMALSQRRQNLINYGKLLDFPITSNLQVTVLPNPVQKIIQLQVLLVDSQDYSITLFDEAGRTIMVNNYVNLPSTILQIQPPEMPEGKYFLRITTTKESQVKRIIYSK